MTNKQPEALRLADKYAAQMMTAEFAKAYGTLAAVQRLSADAAQTRAELETLLRTQHALLAQSKAWITTMADMLGADRDETAIQFKDASGGVFKRISINDTLAAITQHLEPKP